MVGPHGRTTTLAQPMDWAPVHRPAHDGRDTAGAHAGYTSPTSSPILAHFALFYP